MNEAIYALAVICLTLVSLTAIGTRADGNSKVAGKAISALMRILKR